MSVPLAHALRANGALVRVANVWCVGRNYAAHARELHNPVPTTEPVLFHKASTSVRSLSPGEPLAYETDEFHHEIELVLLVERDVALNQLSSTSSAADALGVVGSIGLGLDLTRRTVQSELKAAGKPWTLAKSFAGATVLAPLVSVDDRIDLSDVSFELEINGELRQRGHVNQMIFDLPFLLRYINSFAPLVAGDLIMTGTPEGVGPVRRGDSVEMRYNGPQALRGLSYEGRL